MSNEPKDDAPPPFSCKFIRADDTDERNAILRRPPQTIEEWKQSVDRCTQIVNDRLDEIERQILAKKGE